MNASYPSLCFAKDRAPDLYREGEKTRKAGPPAFMVQEFWPSHKIRNYAAAIEATQGKQQRFIR